MENINIILDPNNDGKDFDEALKDTLPECGNMKVIVKHGVTKGGKSGVLISFSVQMPDGKIQKVQAVTTADLFISAGFAVKGSVERYQAMKGLN